MLLIKQYNKNSTKRLQIKYKFLHKHLSFYKQKTKWISKNIKTTLGRLENRHVKFRQKTELKVLNISGFFKNIFIISNFSNFSTKAREFTIAKNIYNQVELLPSSGVFYPGFKLYPRSYLSFIQNLKKLIGQFIPLYWVPINMYISFLFNKLNNKSSYIKSAGSKGVRKRFNRQEKVINILLPSGTVKIFPIFTLTLFSGSYNLEFNKITEGSWGYFSKNKTVNKV